MRFYPRSLREGNVRIGPHWRVIDVPIAHTPAVAVHWRRPTGVSRRSALSSPRGRRRTFEGARCLRSTQASFRGRADGSRRARRGGSPPRCRTAVGGASAGDGAVTDRPARRSVLLAARRWPHLVSAVFELLVEQRDRLMMQLVIAEQPRVEDRLLMLFWQRAPAGRDTRAAHAVRARRARAEAGPQLAREGASAGHRCDGRGPVRRHAAAAGGARAAQLAVVISSR